MVLSLLLLISLAGCGGGFWESGPTVRPDKPTRHVRVSVKAPKSYYPDLLGPPLPEYEPPGSLANPSYAPGLLSPPRPSGEASSFRAASGLRSRSRFSGLAERPTDGHLDGMWLPQDSAGPRPRVRLLTNKSPSPEFVELNFDNAEIQSVIRAIGELAGINYIIHPNVKGTVTVQTAGKVAMSDLLPTLEQVLAVNGYAVVKVGDLYRVVPSAQARQEPLSARVGRESRGVAEEERFVIQIIPVEFLPLASIQEAVKPLLSANAAIIPIGNTNNFMVVDTSSNVKKVLRVVEILDTNTFDRFHTKLYQLENADPETVARELEQMFTALGFGAKPGSSVVFFPIPRLNSLLVISGLKDLAPAIELWIAQLDQPIERGGEQTFVYYVQHGDAENIAGILQSLFQSTEEETTGQQATATGDKEPGREKIVPPKTEEQAEKAQSLTTGTTKTASSTPAANEIFLFVVPDKETNSIIFRTKPVNYKNVLALVKKLDRKPKQVIIEALVAEVALEGDLELGLEYAFRGVDHSTGVVSAAQLATPLAAPSTIPLATDAAASAASGGLSAFVTNPNRFIGALDAFARDNNLNIISSPSILTAENKPAEISVVTEVPIPRTTTDPNTQTTRTDFEFREVGVKLKITPKINEKRFVTLEIEEELSEVGNRTEGEDAPPNFNSREAKTTVLLKDNQSLVIGGLISERVSETQTGIPFLNRIPILKYIFGSTERERRRTELMVMLTPRVVFDESDSRAMNELYNERLENIQKLFKKQKITRP